MKHLIAFITGILSLSIAFIVHAEGWVNIPELDQDDYTIHSQTTLDRNKGGKGKDLFMAGDSTGVWSLNQPEGELGYVSIHARGGDDVVYAGYALKEVKKAETLPGEWGLWGCDADKQTCLVGKRPDHIYHGVVAFMGRGNDFFYGSTDRDIAFTGDGNDVLVGNGGSDVLIANGVGEYADLHGGGGPDLLWNRRKKGQVTHYPGQYEDGGGRGSSMMMDTVIAGKGTDSIHVQDGNGWGTLIIGFDPAKDTIDGSGGIWEGDWWVNQLLPDDPAEWTEDQRRLASTGWEQEDVIANAGSRFSLPNPGLRRLPMSDQGGHHHGQLRFLNLNDLLPNINLHGHSFTLDRDMIAKGDDGFYSFYVAGVHPWDGVSSEGVYFLPWAGQDHFKDMVSND